MAYRRTAKAVLFHGAGNSLEVLPQALTGLSQIVSRPWGARALMWSAEGHKFLLKLAGKQSEIGVDLFRILFVYARQ